MTDLMNREEFKAWWLHDDQRELRQSCAEGWGFYIWAHSRASIEADLREAFQKGWDASGEGWNAEYPGDCHLKESWQRKRDESLGLKVAP